MLYRPLFWTSFWCEDWLNESNYRGAKRVLISSASAKTAFSLAYCIKRRGLKDVRVVGLTSKRNLEFTKGLGLYDEVGVYDDFETHPSLKLDGQDEKWIYMDVTGNEEFNKRVISHFAPSKKLVLGVMLGMTTITPSSSTTASSELPTSSTANELTETNFKPVEKLMLFFMPEWLAMRRRQLSVEKMTTMQLEMWKQLMRDGKDWVRTERVYGGEKVKDAYVKVVKGGLGADAGMIWSMWDGPEQVKAKM